MNFEWDPDKCRRNIAKHNIDLVDAQEVFERPHIVVRSDRKGEKRFIAIEKAGGLIMTVAYTERGDHIRIISA